MDSDYNHFKSLSTDLVRDIMSRIDGCALSSMASTCTHLRDTERDDILWQKLCHNTWPSTSNKLLQSRGYKSFYADAFPLILYEVTTRVPKNIPTATGIDTNPSPMDFISLVDVYYMGHCVFSGVVDGVIDSIYRTCTDNFQKFLCYPFKLDLVDIKNVEGAIHRENEDARCKLDNELRLSWILFDKKRGKAVNISSWKPRSIDHIYLTSQSYEICFGCIIPTENNIVAECVITAKCKVMNKQGCIKWQGITLVIKDIDGTHLNGEESMAVMKQACVCARSINRHKVESGYQQFCKQKLQLKLRNEKEESLANLLSATAAILALLAICYACATLL